MTLQKDTLKVSGSADPNTRSFPWEAWGWSSVHQSGTKNMIRAPLKCFSSLRQDRKTRRCDLVKKHTLTMWHYAGNHGCQQNIPPSDYQHPSEGKLTSWLDLFLSHLWPSFFLSALPRTTKGQRQVSGWHWFFSFNLWVTVKNNQWSQSMLWICLSIIDSNTNTWI